MSGNEIVVRAPDSSLVQRIPKEQILDRIAQIQQIMKDPAIMKEGVHFGPPNGKKDNDSKDDDKKLKPVLLQPGAEKLLATFRLAADFPVVNKIVDTDGAITYEVKCAVTSQISGEFLGSEWGVCSTNEEKYHWKRCYIDGEYAAAPESEKRLKWRQGWKDKPDYTEKQIRVNPNDVANTVLAMACKRAKVRAVRAALAASDLFEVNIEDLPEDLQQEYFGEDDKPQRKVSDAVNRRQNPGTARPPQQASGQRIGYSHIIAALKGLGWTEPDAEGKDKPSKEAFNFIGKLEVPSKWKEWTPEDYYGVYATLKIEADKRRHPNNEPTPTAEPDGPEPPEGTEDIVDPFESEGDAAWKR